MNREAFQSRLDSVLEFKNAILTRIHNTPPLSSKEIYEQYCHYGEQLAPFIQDTGSILHQMVSQKEAVLLEGAQGTMLDPDFGTYPYVTSSSPLAAGSSIGSGISPKQIDQIVGVFKAYTTRVGGGPMPTELKDETGDFIRERAHEYGATTGRPRRCGWFDAVAGRFSAQINGFSSIALTRLDVLDAFDSVKICTTYRLDGGTLGRFPSDLAILDKCQPVYERLPGWQTPISEIRDFKQLPSQARHYIARLEELLSCPIDIISVGAQRDQTIMVKQIV